MFKLLGTNPNRSVPKLTPPNWGRIRTIIDNGIQESVDYYRNNNQVLLTAHPLITYLETLPISYSLDIDDFINQAYSLGINRTKNFGFTSVLSTGKVHTNVFFGMGSKEVIIAIDKHRPMYEVKRDWKVLSCVQTVRHPYSHLFYQVGTRSPISETKGSSVVIIDVALMAIQYRLFLEEQRRKEKMGGIALSCNHFVQAYVLPGMIRSNINISILNMYLNEIEGLGNSKSSYRLPFNMLNVDNDIRSVVTYITKVIRNRGLSTVEVIGNIEVSDGSLLGNLHLTEGIFLNRQNTWAYLFAVLPVLELAYTLGGKKALNSNSREIEALTLILRNMGYENVLSQGELRGIETEMLLEIRNIREIIKRE